MRSIDRFLAGILLAGAVGGAAVFARHSGSDSSAHAVDLAAPPPQHIGAPGTVALPPPAPTRVAVRVRGRSQARQAAGKPAQAVTAASASRSTIPQATPPQPVAAVQPRTPTAIPAPVLAPQPERALAAVQIAPAQPASKGKGHGHGRALGHAMQHGHDSPPAVEVPAAPASPLAPGDPAAGQVTPPDPSETSSRRCHRERPLGTAGATPRVAPRQTATRLAPWHASAESGPGRSGSRSPCSTSGGGCHRGSVSSRSSWPASTDRRPPRS